MNVVAERLAEVPALPRYTPFLVLAGFTKSSVPEFAGSFELMFNTYRFIQLENDGGRHDNRKFLERVKNLTLLASNSFHSLNISNQLKIPSNHQHGMAKGKGPCDNCCEEHCALYCPHPRNEAKIKKYKEERASCRGGGGRSGERSGGRQGGIKKWTKDNKDGDRNNYGNGV